MLPYSRAPVPPEYTKISGIGLLMLEVVGSTTGHAGINGHHHTNPILWGSLAIFMKGLSRLVSIEGRDKVALFSLNISL